jgi:hypothetical protein
MADVPATDIVLLVFGTWERGMETSASGVPLQRNPEIRKPRSCDSFLEYSPSKLRVFQGKRHVMYHCAFQNTKYVTAAPGRIFRHTKE